LICLRIQTGAGTCGCSNEPPGSIKCKNFLTILEPVSFSRRTLLCIVSYNKSSVFNLGSPTSNKKWIPNCEYLHGISGVCNSHLQYVYCDLYQTVLKYTVHRFSWCHSQTDNDIRILTALMAYHKTSIMLHIIQSSCWYLHISRIL